MKSIVLAMIFCAGIVNLHAQEVSSKPPYNSALATQTGADEFGMKKYVLGLFKAGPAKLSDEKRSEIIKAHLKNLAKMEAEGKVVLAGPLLDRQEILGLFIFNVETIEQAEELGKTDPAINTGVMVMEFHPWYGTAALSELLKIHQTIEKKNFSD